MIVNHVDAQPEHRIGTKALQLSALWTARHHEQLYRTVQENAGFDEERTSFSTLTRRRTALCECPRDIDGKWNNKADSFGGC
jgi:hypothetical protein